MTTVRALSILTILVFAAGSARAQPSGIVAEVEGSAEIGHAGTWAPATIGATVAETDEVRTGALGRMLLVFGEDSVIVVGKDSHLVVDEYSREPNSDSYRFLVHLERGRLKAVIGSLYGKPGAAYEIETSTSVVSVRGTEFVVSHDPGTGTSEVVGVSGQVEVYSALSWTRGAVILSPAEITRIERGDYPSLPRKLPEKLFAQYLGGLSFVGGGRAESLAVGNPLAEANYVLPDDRAAALPAPPELPAEVAVDQPYERSDRGSVADVTGGQPAIPALLPPTGGLDIGF